MHKDVTPPCDGGESHHGPLDVSIVSIITARDSVPRRHERGGVLTIGDLTRHFVARVSWFPHNMFLVYTYPGIDEVLSKVHIYSTTTVTARCNGEWEGSGRQCTRSLDARVSPSCTYPIHFVLNYLAKPRDVIMSIEGSGRARRMAGITAIVITVNMTATSSLAVRMRSPAIRAHLSSASFFL